MNKFVTWLLGQQPASETCVDPRLAELDVQRDEADEQRAEARKLRARAEHLGPKQRARLLQNHFGDGMREALHQRGWTQK